MLNKWIGQGRLVKDPELRTTANGVAVTTFTIAVDHDRKDTEGNRGADFIDVIAWRHTAEFVCKYFQKGKMAIVEGRLQIRSYTDKEGIRRKAAEVIADSVYFGSNKKEDNYQTSDYQSYNKMGSETSRDYSASELTELDNDGELPF